MTRKGLFVIGLGFATFSPCGAHRATTSQEDRSLAEVQRLEKGERALALVEYGPPAPTAEERAEAFAMSLGQGGWVHPLPGPQRRMPIRGSRAFGADRDGHRPYECRSGHCGVDIGGSLWGEQIFSSAAGVVDKVNRDPGRSGGMYVRLSHYEDTVYTQYFHLAAVPRRLRAGMRVAPGEIIGLLGETGIAHSEPHLHFTVSVRAEPDAPEVYIDPEPLIALWPMRHPQDSQTSGPELVPAKVPGVPIGAKGRLRTRPRRSAVAEVAAPPPQQTAALPEAPL